MSLIFTSSRLPRWLVRKKIVPKIPDGVRVYAVGDIHGCRKELLNLIDVILEDSKTAPQDRRIVYLGDYIDRGPDSRGVIEILLEPLAGFNAEYILGNHDQSLLDFLNDPQIFLSWQNFGARETLMSYGVRPPLFEDENVYIKTRDELREALPRRHLSFLQNLSHSLTIGDYFFVHAGVRPGIPLDRQMLEDLLWIRDDFLASNTKFGKVIVHGHTPTMAPERRTNRIGVDTGAYMTGRLTAAVLEGTECRFLHS